MAKASEQFRASDVTLWGIVALCCWGAAVLLANVSAVIPDSVFSALHASRLDGATVSQLRTQVATLGDEAKRMRAENNQLLQRFDRAEEANKDALRRLGALELNLSAVAEAQANASPGVDRMPTAAIGEKAVSFDAEGGSVSVVRKPFPQNQPLAAPMPDVVTPMTDATAYGLGLGLPISPDDAEAQWQSLAAKVGTLLLGLAPLLQDVEGDNGKIIVAGPVTDLAQAEQLCLRMDRVGIPCMPKPFKGEPLPLLN